MQSFPAAFPAIIISAVAGGCQRMAATEQALSGIYFLISSSSRGDKMSAQHVAEASAATTDSSTATATPVEQSYTVTTLDPSDLDEWLDHLTTTFSHKPTPRSYFYRHVLHDPHIDYSGIITIHTPRQRCVSSVRVFLRVVWVGGSGVVCGGIGEVSTQVEWRGRGYAAVCLQRAVEYMQSLGVPLSSLHTSNAAKYYQQLGWQPVERVHGLVPIDRIQPVAAGDDSTTSNSYSIQQLTGNQLTSSPLLSSISAVYDSYARHFNGPVQRTAEYWQRWVDAEHAALAATPNPVIILVAVSTAPSSAPAAVDVCGYAFLQRFDRPIDVQRVATFSEAASSSSVSVSSRLQVREFACSASEMSRDGGRAVFLSLLRHSLQHNEQFRPALPADSLYVHYALPIALTFCPPLDSEYEHVDTGFMYRPIEPASAASAAVEGQQSGRYKREDFALLSQQSGQQLLSALQADGRNKHVFFATDAF